MSLNIYLHKEDIPKNITLYDNNDLFFDGSTLLRDSAWCERILKEIDKASYNSSETFIGRDKELGAIYREHLSTGGKTLLNILEHPDCCFSLIECGANAKELALQLPTGNLLWIPDQLFIEDDVACDAICNGVHFDVVGNLIDFMSEEM